MLCSGQQEAEAMIHLAQALLSVKCSSGLLVVLGHYVNNFDL